MSRVIRLFALVSPLALTQCVDPLAGPSLEQLEAIRTTQSPQVAFAPTQLDLNYVSLATATDAGPQDGIFDSFAPANLGSVNNNGFTSMRTAFEFSLGSIPPGATIEAAALTVRLYNDPGIRSLQVHGYSGDGAVALGDFALDGLVASFSAGTWGQFFPLDVTSFVAGLVSTGSSHAGFNVREQPANSSNLTVMALGVSAWPPVLTVVFSTEQVVDIDIKPGTNNNTINSGSRGKIPVAVLGGPTFDPVTALAPTSLTFGQTGDEASLTFCNPLPADVNGDGLLDLLCHFSTETSAFLPSDTHGVLKGATQTGVRIIGADAVRIVP